jgi:hypothetical protein
LPIRNRSRGFSRDVLLSLHTFGRLEYKPLAIAVCMRRDNVTGLEGILDNFCA